MLCGLCCRDGGLKREKVKQSYKEEQQKMYSSMIVGQDWKTHVHVFFMSSVLWTQSEPWRTELDGITIDSPFIASENLKTVNYLGIRYEHIRSILCICNVFQRITSKIKCLQFSPFKMNMSISPEMVYINTHRFSHSCFKLTSIYTLNFMIISMCSL